MRCAIETFDVATGAIRVVMETDRHIEAPNWSRDGGHLLVNSEGLLFEVPLSGVPRLKPFDTGFAVRCNNDHGYSPDGTLMAISDSTEEGRSCIYVLPATGGMPRRVTDKVPSWWHGWSPDGSQLAYTAVRGDLFSIRTIAVEGGPERVVAEGPGHYDGPDYSPGGRWLWFNATRGGTMQLWKADLSTGDLVKVTDDERVNWFPHPSPDGRTVVYLSYEAGTEGHPAGRNVELRLIDTEGNDMRTAVRLFGGQGTINVPSWSPDGSAFAYVRYFET